MLNSKRFHKKLFSTKSLQTWFCCLCFHAPCTWVIRIFVHFANLANLDNGKLRQSLKSRQSWHFGQSWQPSAHQSDRQVPFWKPSRWSQMKTSHFTIVPQSLHNLDRYYNSGEFFLRVLTQSPPPRAGNCQSHSPADHPLVRLLIPFRSTLISCPAPCSTFCRYPWSCHR